MAKGIAWAIVAVCALRVIDEFAPFGGLGVSELLSPRDGSVVSGRLGIETAISIGSIAMAGLVRRSQTAIGGVFLLIGFGVLHFTVMQQLHGQYIFAPDASVFSVLSEGAATAGMVCVYASRRAIRGAFLTSTVGRQIRIMAAFTVVSITLLGLLFERLLPEPDEALLSHTVLLAAIAVIFLGMVLYLGRKHEASDADRRQFERRINHQNRTDCLTGVLNRHGTLEKMKEAWDRRAETQAGSAVVLVDLDHFKSVNDVYGHVAGEEVLRRVGEALRNAVRPSDVVGRWGGAEFVVLISLNGGNGPITPCMRQKPQAAIMWSKHCCGLLRI